MRLSDIKNTAPIPYRDSKLTRLLQPALEGDSKVNIICNISPSSNAYEETLSTLKFAQRAKKIKQTIKKNEFTDEKTLIVKYEKEIRVLQEKLQEMEAKMNTELNKEVPEEIVNKLYELQEEKELSDFRLESLLQEKIKLQRELEQFKSFIIHPEDVKTPKISIIEDDNTSSQIFRKSMQNIQIIKDGLELNLRKSIAINEKIDEEKSVVGGETLLTENIDKIFDILNSEEPLARISTVVTEQKDVHSDCFKIIEEQDKIIHALQKNLREKQDEIGVLKDELALCRNNIANLRKFTKG